MRPIAHPTTYGGARFRSRLEARWAAFFDLAGWEWQYEPGDYEGWAPDFALIGASGTVLVEVKPINWHGGRNEMVAAATKRDDLAKVWMQRDQEILIVGCYPILDTTWWDGLALGLLHDIPAEGQPCGPGAACDIAVLWGGIGRLLDFAGSSGSFAYRIGGQYDGDHHLRHVSSAEIRRVWNEAGAAVQWRRS